MKIHVFATIMALYPFTSTRAIAQEFGLSQSKVKAMAAACHVKKNDDFRSEINRRNGRKATERKVVRRKNRQRRAIEMNNEGSSVTEIARRMRISRYTVYKYLEKVKKIKL
jgi:transposase